MTHSHHHQDYYRLPDDIVESLNQACTESLGKKTAVCPWCNFQLTYQYGLFAYYDQWLCLNCGFQAAGYFNL